MTEFTHDQQGLILDQSRQINEQEQTIRSLYVWIGLLFFWASCVTLALIFKP